MPKTTRKMPRMDTNLNIQSVCSTTKCNAKRKRQTHLGLNCQPKITSKNGSKSSPKGSKWHPKSILEASWEAKLKRSRFLMPRGRLKDLFWGAIWESKIVPNTFWKRFQDACDFEHRFGTVLGRLGHQFLSVFSSFRELR